MGQGPGPDPSEVRVVAAAILQGGAVLAARRGPGQSRPGLWELPGGKVEPGETDAGALAREIHEELGARVRVGACLGEAVHAYRDLTVRLVALACRLEPGEVLRAREHDALRWLGPDELHAVTWAPADLPLLDAVRRAIEAGSPGGSG